MRVFPDYPGPMSEWPRVQAIRGVARALTELKRCHALVLATNAADSDAEHVRLALERVGLAMYFDAIYTTHELGARKPAPDFFRAILERWMLSPQQAAMVGDDYRVDVLGARQAGLWAVWYNPQANPCLTPHPWQDAEVRSMATLPRSLARLRLPGVAECLAWLQEHGASAGLAAHSLAVAAGVHRLAWRLRQGGARLDQLLAHRGGLLHDLDKPAVQLGQGRHGSLAAKWLYARDQPELARIVARHQVFAVMGSSRPRTWEQKLVYLVDKLVQDHRVEGLARRFAVLQERHPASAADLARCLPLAQALEDELCAKLGLSSEDLLAEVSQAINASNQGV